MLQRHGFRVLVLSRHPLDVLISILHFVRKDRETNNWLGGEGGDERSIFGASPCSPQFLAYATSERAKALLSVSREWWPDPQRQWMDRLANRVADRLPETLSFLTPKNKLAFIPIRYEDMVSDGSRS